MALNSFTTDSFWACYSRLPKTVQAIADKQFKIWLANPSHQSVRFKRLKGDIWSARVNDQYRALAAREGNLVSWFWIGPHAEYDKLIARL